jgi:hypothetical protein
MADEAKQWTRAIIAPVLVGLIAGFLGSQASLAVHGERIMEQGRKIDRLEAQMDELRSLQVAIARLEVEAALTRATMDRLVVSVERMHGATLR